MTEFKEFTLASSYYLRGKPIHVSEMGIFEISPTKKKINANTVAFNGKYPYVARGEGNNGIRGYINYNTKYLNPGNTISFGQDTGTMYFQPSAYFTGDKIQVFKMNPNLNQQLNYRVAMYLIATARKIFSNFTWGQNSFALDEIAHLKLELPVYPHTDKINFQYMEDIVRAHEQDRIKLLDNYLITTKLNDCLLTSDDKRILRLRPNFKCFLMKDLFKKLKLKRKKKDWDKKKDTSTTPSLEFDLPLINAKAGNNGIMYYGRSEDWESADMSIDIIQNGAIATGLVYAQPQATGQMWDAYLIRYIPHRLNKEQLLYFAAVIEKAIQPKYNYEHKATWPRVQNESIQLPVDKSGNIDLIYMEKYIKVIQKIVVKTTVKYANQPIE